MDLRLNTTLVGDYKSQSQIARVLTEDWLARNSYCPACGQASLVHFENNRPVADFFCQNCSEEYELKSKKGKFSQLINDGAYATMMERVQADNNPNFFFLTYSKSFEVDNFLVLPKQFIRPETIIKRPPLRPGTRRAGWVACQIDLSQVPSKGRVFLVKNGQVRSPELVAKEFQDTLFLREKSLATRGWLLEVLKCVDKIPDSEFDLSQVYAFEDDLKKIYPENQHIKDKIRQQLQVLRDKGVIAFLGNGRYRK